MATERKGVKGLKKGSYLMVDGEPCKVRSMSKSKPGRHGAAKVRIEAEGLFDGKRRSLTKPGTAEVEVPIIDKRNGQVVSVSGDSAQIMDLETYETFEMAVPDEVKGDLEAGKEVAYWKVAGKSVIRDVK